jgi:hypothetical protein
MTQINIVGFSLPMCAFAKMNLPLQKLWWEGQLQRFNYPLNAKEHLLKRSWSGGQCFIADKIEEPFGVEYGDI